MNTTTYMVYFTYSYRLFRHIGGITCSDDNHDYKNKNIILADNTIII